jgi:putative heme iron utilization protein
MSATQGAPAPTFDAKAEAKLLLRTARTAALATLDSVSGAPLTTLVATGSDYDGAPLLLLSTLARHTKNLAADARASLLLTSPAGRGDPLNRPRLSLGGRLVAYLSPSAKARFIARNPKSKLYAAFADFSIFRMEISDVHFNGGFARAAALTPEDISTVMTNARALIEAEETLLDEINARGQRFLAQLAGSARGDKPRRWRAIGLDPEGLDLAAGVRAARINFEASAPDPRAWRDALEACSPRTV